MNLNDTGRREYRRFRAQGWNAAVAISYARTAVQWRHAADAGLVQMSAEPDEYGEVGLDPAAYTASVIRAEECRAAADGMWGIVGRYRLKPEGPWIDADSVWGFVGEDYQESGYDLDVRSQTLSSLRDALRSRCPRCREVAS